VTKSVASQGLKRGVGNTGSHMGGWMRGEYGEQSLLPIRVEYGERKIIAIQCSRSTDCHFVVNVWKQNALCMMSANLSLTVDTPLDEQTNVAKT